MKKLHLILSLILVTLAVSCLAAMAATTNPSPASTGYTPVVLPITGTYSSATLPGVVKFKAPNGYVLKHASATARAVSGTSPTLTVDIKSGATSVLSTPVSVTAGTITDAVLTTNPKLTDEGTVSIDLAAGGTSPKWRDITVFILLKRL